MVRKIKEKIAENKRRMVRKKQGGGLGGIGSRVKKFLRKF